ncbi:UDP-glucose:(heptosyl) LPS alpha1,3-glucosyltransferase WaaG [hydrothermal vent metagenome]|uniref:UDP-glucose:(Heptosyl) LPS alpha1,3-glucosyltransferase WaaG n=1 Tax=hydrothermal vent metagenome TaxID=652676 RepID=A0A3B1BH74_9ZZZZ
MKLAFVLFKYFPFGGLQRDMLRIAHVCQTRGHDIHVYCLTWEGAVPAGVELHLLPIKRLTNHAKYEAFHKALQIRLEHDGIEGVIGFNRMPGLDLYYAADACFKEKLSQRNRLIQLGPRYRHFLEYEEAVFGAKSQTHVLLISPPQLENFVQHYGTSRDRLHLLPPGITRDRVVPPNAEEVRAQFRQEFNLADEQHLLLAIGSGFKTKGLDRTLKAIHSLPRELRERTRLIAMGNDNPRSFIKMAKRLGLEEQFEVMSGRDDVPRFLQGGDLLMHPAYNENTGTVLLEALVAGLPVLTTESCGYAFHVEQSGGGRVVPSPFKQERLNQELLQMLDSPQRDQWRKNGIAYGAVEDLYSMPELAADIILNRVDAK